MIVNIDAKSLEWITYLYLSQDKVGIDEWYSVLEDPKKNDMHSANQQKFNLPDRRVAKFFLFRAIYRGTAYAYSVDPDFTHVSRSQNFWQDVIDKFFLKYKDLDATHQRYIREVTTTGRLVSPFGREYLYEPRKNKRTGDLDWSIPDICNWINQGLGADVMAVARVVAKSRFNRYKLRSRLESTVHDSIVSDSPDDEVQTVTEIFHGVFKDLPRAITQAYGVEWNVPLIGEVSVGPNMHDLVEVPNV